VATAVTAPLPGFGPVTPQERIETLDILRGWAIFGILLVDIEVLYRLGTWTGTEQSVYLAGTTAFTTVLRPAGPFYSEFIPFTTTVLVGLGRQLGSPALGLGTSPL